MCNSQENNTYVQMFRCIFSFNSFPRVKLENLTRVREQIILTGSVSFVNFNVKPSHHILEAWKIWPSLTDGVGFCLKAMNECVRRGESTNGEVGLGSRGCVRVTKNLKIWRCWASHETRSSHVTPSHAVSVLCAFLVCFSHLVFMCGDNLSSVLTD